MQNANDRFILMSSLAPSQHLYYKVNIITHLLLLPMLPLTPLSPSHHCHRCPYCCVVNATTTTAYRVPLPPLPCCGYRCVPLLVLPSRQSLVSLLCRCYWCCHGVAIGSATITSLLLTLLCCWCHHLVGPKLKCCGLYVDGSEALRSDVL